MALGTGTADLRFQGCEVVLNLIIAGDYYGVYLP